MKENEMADQTVKITVNSNASLKVEYPQIEVHLPDGSIVIKEGKAFFCRCGESKNKPFCDGTHKSCGFEG